MQMLGVSTPPPLPFFKKNGNTYKEILHKMCQKKSDARDFYTFL